ncbi:MAG: multifunctional oxoglutarate decarboxylase/oxoglutarate dehydrogenase thiamine pyrophosphate-binding subunit/dihydrolipoyllysine-residue succinyltransferase subunit [Acidimicrobiia bacterium]
MSDSLPDFGPNSGVVEEMFRQYQANPNSVGEAWREFFADYVPRTLSPTPSSVAQVSGAPAQAPLVLSGDDVQPLRGVAARIVTNMEASLGVPTATSVRAVPAKLLEVNRTILNNHLARNRGGKVSFTHLIAYAIVRALHQVPAMNTGYGDQDGTPVAVHHKHVNLGIAVDMKKSDGSRSLVVPNIKESDTLDFAGFFHAYEEVIRRVRANKLSPDDFAGTTGSITNPGGIGTVHSVPRLMPGQAFIIGVGSIDYPAEYQGADAATVARLGLSKVVTLTSTYDHRVIQGAESGEFLRWVNDLLLGAEGFYDDVFASLGVPYEPARWTRDTYPVDDPMGIAEKVVHVHQLINMYRVRGHLIANLDPLGRSGMRSHPELEIEHYGLSIWDLDREFPVDGLAAQHRMALRDILSVVRDAYARSVGIEYMHIQDPDQKAWIQQHVEVKPDALTTDEKRRILERLNAAEAFERFLHTKFLGHKRFSLEGAESLIVMLDGLLSEATNAEMTDAVLGMAHRGRLNVLANVIGKSYSQIFREFEGELDPSSMQGSGDVKYHLGATGVHRAPDGNTLELTLASNPSHLEAVDPVVEGMTRAMQDQLASANRIDRVLPVLVHGDAAFAGQGVVAETLNLSEVPGYEVGGTVHIVVNNQLGFTTDPEAGRSGTYATEVAKMVQAPIFHVNGDDPEACLRVIRLAFAFRQQFHKDVVVDMICYRRYGHNETDEPAFTQPDMYRRIEKHRSVRKLYTEVLTNRGDLTIEEAEAALDDFNARLAHAFEETHQTSRPTGKHAIVAAGTGAGVSTGVERSTLERIVESLLVRPVGFAVHPKLERILSAQRTSFDTDQIDWALGEALAFGSMLLEGTPVRLAGQDSRRGTFSQRHAVLVDAETEAEFAPLAHLSEDQAPFMIYDSTLSEFAVLGFEYGYSVSAPKSFVGWEAQFGDFANGAQTIIDQFIAAAQDKWAQLSTLTMLLPHGYEGQGPEHSSARIERFLTLGAEENMRIIYPTTSAQYFHALRRQVRADARRPLVVFTPKRYLRMAQTKSPVAAFTSGSFQLVLDDRAATGDAPTLKRDAVHRIVFCTGKVAHELMDARDAASSPVAVVRIEQLYPFPVEEVQAILEQYPNATDFLWAQEEPANMGAWGFVRPRLEALLGRDRALHHVARDASASPASGSQSVHDDEQRDLLTRAVRF